MAQVGLEQKKKYAPRTMVMQIANAHSFSVGFIGIQLTHGYVAALALSSVSVVVGLIVSLQSAFPGPNALWWAFAAGLPLGGIVAFVFDAMTIFGLKMYRESSGAKRKFSYVIIGLGIGLSTMAGDQMWSLVYHGDWHSWVLAAAVSCVIIMVEVWNREHEQAVQKASKNTDTMQTALATEVEVTVDKMLREYTHEALQSPMMQESLRQQSAENVKAIVQKKFDQRLANFVGTTVEGSVTKVEPLEEKAEPLRELPEPKAEPQMGKPEPQMEKPEPQMEKPEPIGEETEPQLEKSEPIGEETEPQMGKPEPLGEETELEAEPMGEEVEPLGEKERKAIERKRWKEGREKFLEYMEEKPNASLTEIMYAFSLPKTTAHDWRNKFVKAQRAQLKKQQAMAEKEEQEQEEIVVEQETVLA